MIISTVPGPVAYPLIASTMKRHDFEIKFEKVPNANVYLDAIPLLGKIDYVLLSKLLIITPKIGKKIAVWKKGSANDIFLQLLIKLYNISPQLVYTDNPLEVHKLYQNGEVDSALVTVGVTTEGIVIEDLFKSKGVTLPGICGAKGENEDFSSIYKEGIDLFKENPEEVSEYIADNLPVSRPSSFIESIFKNAEYKVERVNFNFDELKNGVLHDTSSLY
ncbi:DUF3834 domain-containing protein [Sulfurisphaera ohwakuensis]|uniref:DUF3834 domain-containing protein n=1 Tax=Sulfurisphaera ohwakuensis TaxID=69656 RepID=A0A650CJX2_SULOH|nr:DUF3834 domain-containing protein [Sulfurisphaera ohwakuensis]MBB5254502.1 hypothetical protein [Sulfurisphaera ohwakuensis]QGR18116.1 DUF3834 domain-containing protein [Sulfurisphaera ohwakuensis]